MKIISHVNNLESIKSLCYERFTFVAFLFADATFFCNIFCYIEIIVAYQFQQWDEPVLK